MKYIIITNNNMVNKKFKSKARLIKGNVWDVVKKVRDMVYQNHRLLTHPLTGNLKPTQTPYKSIILSGKKQTVDYDSVMLITSTIETIQNLGYVEIDDIKDEKIRDDYMFLDYCFMSSAVKSLDKF